MCCRFDLLCTRDVSLLIFYNFSKCTDILGWIFTNNLYSTNKCIPEIKAIFLKNRNSQIM